MTKASSKKKGQLDEEVFMKKKGQLDEEVFISAEVFGKIVDLMECIHNLDGNYDESEVLQVADALRDFSSSDLDHINSLDHIDTLEI